MLNNSKPYDPKQKQDTQTIAPKQKRKQDALELAQLVYDMYVAHQTDRPTDDSIESEGNK